MLIVHPLGLEPRTTVPKTVVISVSPRVQFRTAKLYYYLRDFANYMKGGKVHSVCGHGLVVEHVLAKDEMGVRFSLAALVNKTTFQNDMFTHKRH
jgi:hypothetical protein